MWASGLGLIFLYLAFVFMGLQKFTPKPNPNMVNQITVRNLKKITVNYYGQERKSSEIKINEVAKLGECYIRLRILVWIRAKSTSV